MYPYPSPRFLMLSHIVDRSQGLFTQAGFNDPSQEDSSQTHFSVAGPGPLQSQVKSTGHICVIMLVFFISSGMDSDL